MDAFADADNECVDEADEDGAKLVLDVFGADVVEGVGGVEELAEVPFDEWRRRRGRSRAIAELAVDDAVPEVIDATSAVYRVEGGLWDPIA